MLSLLIESGKRGAELQFIIIIFFYHILEMHFVGQKFIWMFPNLNERFGQPNTYLGYPMFPMYVVCK